jgi:hypothetical protein
MKYPFGNDPKKIEGYRKFWKRSSVSRPLVGFTYKGWLPVQEYSKSSSWPEDTYLAPSMVDPQDYLDDQERMLLEGNTMDDDIIRGACPHQGIPWNCGMLGGKLRILPGSVLAEDMNLDLANIPEIRLDDTNPWFCKYLDYAEALVKHADGRYPVSHGSVVGPSDLVVILRGHVETVLDMMGENDGIQDLFSRMADLFIKSCDALWERVPLWEDGYYDAQYYLWAPGSIARLQEDALPVFSPDLYKKYIQHLDEKIASRYDYSFMHLHSTSMFVLDHLLDVKSIRAFEVNNDVAGPPISEMITYIRKIQEQKKPVIFRGSFTNEDMTEIKNELDPCGLYLHIMIEREEEIGSLRKILGM